MDIRETDNCYRERSRAVCVKGGVGVCRLRNTRINLIIWPDAFSNFRGRFRRTNSGRAASDSAGMALGVRRLFVE